MEDTTKEETQTPIPVIVESPKPAVQPKPQPEPLVTVRQLNASDIFTVLRLMSTSVGTVKKVKELMSTVSTAGQGGDTMNAGMATIWAIVQGLMTRSYDDTIAWLADLSQVTPEEFLKLPPTAIIDVFEQLQKQEGAEAFFSRFSDLFTR